jgi:glycosyltransferase involved in cell wall biosynthesis
MPLPSPFFSIIIPSFQRMELLGYAIASVKRQSFHDMEIIVVEDALEPSLPQLEGVQVLARGPRHPKGANACRNIGLQHARGQYVLFLDDDDLLSPNALRRLYEALGGHEADLCIGLATWFGEKAEAYGIDGPKTMDALIRGETKWAISSAVWRREFVLDRKLSFDSRLQNAQEWLFHVEALLAKPKIIEIPHLISEIRAHKHNRSWQVDRHYLRNQIRARQIAGGKLLLAGHLPVALYLWLRMLRYVGAYFKHLFFK